MKIETSLNFSVANPSSDESWGNPTLSHKTAPAWRAVKGGRRSNGVSLDGKARAGAIDTFRAGASDAVRPGANDSARAVANPKTRKSNEINAFTHSN